MSHPTLNAAPRFVAEPRVFEPLSVRGSAADYRIAHALEAMAGALCRIDQRLALLADRTAPK